MPSLLDCREVHVSISQSLDLGFSLVASTTNYTVFPCSLQGRRTAQQIGKFVFQNASFTWQANTKGLADLEDNSDAGSSSDTDEDSDTSEKQEVHSQTDADLELGHGVVTTDANGAQDLANNKEILQGIDLEIPQGKLVVVHGMVGAGKHLLLYFASSIIESSYHRKWHSGLICNAQL